MWFIVVWADGTHERSREDYAPWTYVAEMFDGYFLWDEGGARDGRYEFAWLSPSDVDAQRMRLGIKSDDF